MPAASHPFQVVLDATSPSNFGTGRDAWLAPVAKKCTCGEAGHVPLMLTNSAGQRWGGKALRDSQTCTVEFAEAIVQAWLEVRAKLDAPLEGNNTWKNRDANTTSTSWRDRTSSSAATTLNASTDTAAGEKRAAKYQAHGDVDWKRRC